MNGTKFVKSIPAEAWQKRFYGKPTNMEIYISLICETV